MDDYDVASLRLKGYDGKALFVRGLPGGSEHQLVSTEQHSIVDHLTASEMNKAVEIKLGWHNHLQLLLFDMQPAIHVPSIENMIY